MDRKFIGSIGIVNTGNSTAQLRWFLVEPEIRGKGLGNKLIKTALSFCKEKGYQQVFLWTINFLEIARKLYKKYGFQLVDTLEHDIWGRKLREEYWILKLE